MDVKLFGSIRFEFPGTTDRTLLQNLACRTPSKVVEIHWTSSDVNRRQ